MDANDLYMAVEGPIGKRYFWWSCGSRDYHSGPLTLIIRLAYGSACFRVFVIASLQTLYRYCKFGDPELRNINRVLLATFIARWFLLIRFGAFALELFVFTG